MEKAYTVSSTELPDAFKPYQDAIELIWNDNMKEEDVNPIFSKLCEFVDNKLVPTAFISNMIEIALKIKTKNYHIIHQIAQKIKGIDMEFYHQIDPNPILWNDDVETFVTKDFNKQDIADAALYGAVKCFKVLAGKFSEFTDDLCAKAIAGGNIEIIRILDRHLNFATIENLLAAMMYHRNEIVDWILEKDPSLNESVTTMDCFIYKNYQYLIYLIRNHQYFFECSIIEDRFNYYSLAQSYTPSFWKALFDLGLDINFKYRDCYETYNLLIQAAHDEMDDLVRFLVLNGANVNSTLYLCFMSTTTENYSALKFAVMHNNLELTKFLLDHGASRSILYESRGCFHNHFKPIYDYAKSQEMKDLLYNYENNYFLY